MRPFLLVAGARPNFMKVAPIARVFRKRKIAFRFLHTGQHHDPSLSTVFLRDLGLGRPDYNLGVGSGSHAQTTARVLEKAEPILQKLRPRAVIVVGDVNSTLAMALVATKLHLPVAHVEAGLRSGDRLMPEETNRVLTDQISDLLLTPSPDGDKNLLKEGIPQSRIVRVGNVMIDSLVAALTRSAKKKRPFFQNKILNSGKGFFLMTFHRPSNVDTKEGLKRLIAFFKKSSALLPVQLPLHPRTRVQLQKYGLWKTFRSVPNLIIEEPMGYFDFVTRMQQATAVVTDSGGVQEETTYLGVPCLIMRTTTERPICVDRGTAELMGEDFGRAYQRLQKILQGRWKKSCTIPLWDGRTAERIVRTLLKFF